MDSNNFVCLVGDTDSTQTVSACTRSTGHCWRTLPTCPPFCSCTHSNSWLSSSTGTTSSTPASSGHSAHWLWWFVVIPFYKVDFCPEWTCGMWVVERRRSSLIQNIAACLIGSFVFRLNLYPVVNGFYGTMVKNSGWLTAAYSYVTLFSYYEVTTTDDLFYDECHTSPMFFKNPSTSSGAYYLNCLSEFLGVFLAFNRFTTLYFSSLHDQARSGICTSQITDLATSPMLLRTEEKYAYYPGQNLSYSCLFSGLLHIIYIYNQSVSVLAMGARTRDQPLHPHLRSSRFPYLR